MTMGRPQPGLAGNSTRLALSQDRRGTTPGRASRPQPGVAGTRTHKILSQDWRGTPPTRTSARIGEGPQGLTAAVFDVVRDMSICMSLLLPLGHEHRLPDASDSGGLSGAVWRALVSTGGLLVPGVAHCCPRHPRAARGAVVRGTLVRHRGPSPRHGRGSQICRWCFPFLFLVNLATFAS